MGFLLSLLYIVTHYFSPEYLFGSAAKYHIELILAILVLLTSIPALTKTFLFRTFQAAALVGLVGAAFLSQTIGNHWLGGGIHSVLDFIPNGLAYFVLCLHCTTKRRLQIVVLLLAFVCLSVTAHGYSDLIRGVAINTPPPGTGLGLAVQSGATASPYLLRQEGKAGQWIYRLQGLGMTNDPNDFGQLLVCVIPLMLIFWRPKKPLTNVLLVIIPICALLFGAYLTHSRGALLAVIAVILFAARRRIGTVPASVFAVILFVGAMGLQFSGGRDISASAGEDRASLWGEALAVFRMHPLVGVGFGNLGSYTDSGLTAHNSVLVCASELGIVGLYFWSLFLLATIRDAIVLAFPKEVAKIQPVVEEDTGPLLRVSRRIESLDKDEIYRLGSIVLLSLIGFLAAGLFLSRALVMTLFILGGMVEVVYEMAWQQRIVGPRLPLKRALSYSACLTVGLIVAMYTLVLVLNHFR